MLMCLRVLTLRSAWRCQPLWQIDLNGSQNVLNKAGGEIKLRISQGKKIGNYLFKI